MKPHTTAIFTEKTLERLSKVVGNRSGFLEKAIRLVHSNKELREAVIERIKNSTDGGPKRHVSLTISREAKRMAEELADKVPTSKSRVMEQVVKEILVNRKVRGRILRELILEVPTRPQ